MIFVTSATFPYCSAFSFPCVVRSRDTSFSSAPHCRRAHCCSLSEVTAFLLGCGFGYWQRRISADHHFQVASWKNLSLFKRNMGCSFSLEPELSQLVYFFSLYLFLVCFFMMMGLETQLCTHLGRAETEISTRQLSQVISSQK